MRRRNACWDVLPPQDIMYGLDLLKGDELEMLKDVIRTQRQMLSPWLLHVAHGLPGSGCANVRVP